MMSSWRCPSSPSIIIRALCATVAAIRIGEGAFVKEQLSRAEDIGVEHVARIAADFDVLRLLRKATDHLDNLALHRFKNGIGIIECPEKVYPLGKVRCVEVEHFLCGDPGLLEHRPAMPVQFLKRHVRQLVRPPAARLRGEQ